MNAKAKIRTGSRFGSGANGTRFLTVLDEARIAEAEASLRDMLAVADLQSRRFLDIGCGSGLFNRAARRLGAEVFGLDLRSVTFAQEVKRCYFPQDSAWRVEQGSVRDSRYIERLGKFDVVYRWRLLHHTGSMWVAIENAISRVATPCGAFFIAIYNDQGWKSPAWSFVNFMYNRMPRLLKKPFVIGVSTVTHALVIIKYIFKLKPMVAIAPPLIDRRERGTSAPYDAVDWIGGFPHEFSSFDTLAGSLEARGFSLTNCRPYGSQGRNELVLQRTSEPATCAE